MTVYNLLKSGAVLVGLATGSAAIAAGINGIGTMLGGDSWRAAVGHADAVREPGRMVHVAEGGMVGRPDFTLFAPGETVSGYVSGGSSGSVILPAMMAGSGTYDFSFADSERRSAPPFVFRANGGASSATPAAAARRAATASEAGTVAPGLSVASFARGNGSGMVGVQSLAAAVPGDDEDEALATPMDDLVAAFDDEDPLLTDALTAVPLPAGGALMLSALLGLGILRRSRRG